MTNVKLSNGAELELARRGLLPAEQVRSVELCAIIDTGAVLMALPADVCDALGLCEIDRRTATLADGTRRELSRFGPIWIEILGRGMTCDAWKLPVGTTPLVGQIPLEGLDLVVDPASGEARPNPAHPDGPVWELFGAA